MVGLTTRIAKILPPVQKLWLLHGNIKKLLSLVQLDLHVLIQAFPPRPMAVFKGTKGRAAMQILAISRPAWSSGSHSKMAKTRH